MMHRIKVIDNPEIEASLRSRHLICIGYCGCVLKGDCGLSKGKDDSKQDIERLYNALARNNKNEATIILTHLIKVHQRTRKDVAASIKVLGTEKIVLACKETTKTPSG